MLEKRKKGFGNGRTLKSRDVGKRSYRNRRQHTMFSDFSIIFKYRFFALLYHNFYILLLANRDYIIRSFDFSGFGIPDLGNVRVSRRGGNRGLWLWWGQASLPLSLPLRRPIWDFQVSYILKLVGRLFKAALLVLEDQRTIFHNIASFRYSSTACLDESCFLCWKFKKRLEGLD